MNWEEQFKAALNLQPREKPGIVITRQPECASVPVGYQITLYCSAIGPTPLQYQWFEGKKEIAPAEMRHHGSYLCAVTNDRGQECWSSAVDVSIVENVSVTVSLPTLRVKATHQNVRLCASDKVALLIGNMNYLNHPKLVATMMDVFELSNLLQQLNFRVVSLLDLTKEELRSAVKQFLQLLDTGVYALFYYAGHGYECAGRNYMVPVNAPNPYKPENCINVQKILCRMQEKNTALNVLLLDMCRKWYNQDCLPSDLQPLAPTGNIVYGYATCEDAKAYEIQDGEYSSGIFMKYLKKHILKKEKVTQILENVSEDMGKDRLITGKQVMEIRHSLKERRALTDEICVTGHTAQLQVRNEHWGQANELPGKRAVCFPCGVEVELSCSAVFSNVMTVYVSIKAKPSQVSECKVSLQKAKEFADNISDFDGDASHLDSLFSSLKSIQPSDVTLKLCGLQKLKQPLAIRVTIQYQCFKKKLKQEETLDVNLGLPLVARLELYRTMPTTEAARDVTSSSKGRDAASPGTVTADASCACRTGIRRPPNQQGVNDSAHHQRLNEPEENDEGEIAKWS
ncbi:mucosa-associated lymphoid tissue lymphoma translocation protein 1 isoform X2 [Narcine bancroftii]|uniref:mucosa-associated lymphoid tissue lymphoma translocation protein 1 isoform X2 n=1 Tax=Narcine bancroftii TaxID=1343680 RepID=UPI003831E339